MRTYNWDISQSGNIRLTGKMVPAGVDQYPLLSAGSLSWDGVEVESGVNLNTTDDLLNYIKGGNGTINDRIDELELSNAGYEIRCNKSVCYVGDTLDKVSVQIYKNGSLLTWTQIQTEGITLKTPITKPAGGNDLMWFTSNGQWLNGTANVAGTYIFEFMKNDVCIALFRFIVLIPAYKSATITVYKSSDTLPLKPVGVSYNFNSNPASINVGESGWTTSTTDLTGTIWFCTGHVNEANPSVVSWNEPCIYLNSKIVNTENEYRVKEIAVYKACHGAYTDGTNSYSEAVAAKPTGSGAQHCYLFNVDPSLDSFTAPGGWSETPQAAIDAYKNSQSTPTNLKSNYVVWKTYNSYRITVNKLTTPNTLVADSYAESGWATPVKYMDIDLILKEAKTQSLSIANSAIAAARADLEAGLNLETIIDAVNVLFAWRIVGDGNSSLSSDYTELIDDADTTSTQHELFSRFSSYIDSSTNKYTGHIEMINSSPNLCIPGYQMKALKFDPILEDGAPKGCKWIAFVPTTTEIRTLISDLNDDLGELSTAVNSMKPDEIRLQVSKGFMEDVTWTEVDENEWADARTEMIEDPEDEESDFWYYGADMTTRSKRHGYKYVNGDYEQIYAEYDSTSNSYDYLSGLPVKADANNGGYVYGHYYIVSKPGSVSDNKYFRCDYPISTGFLNILADKLKLGVVNTTGARSTLLLKVDGVSSSAQLSASLIVLDGDTIADAINAKSLNINNTTYLNTDGSVFFGVPNGTAIANPSTSSTLPTATGGIKRSSRFNTDGSGELCGGNINWTSNGVLYVKEAHIGESGSDWLIKTASNLPTIYSKDNSTNQELFITPQYLEAVKNSTTYWAIQRDGYARFAQGRAEFSPTGVFHLGGLPNTQTTSGKQDGYMHFDPTEGTLTIGGENVVIASDVMALITAGVADTDEFASIVADAASSSVSINGMLATQDIDVGNGSSYFSTGHDTKTYRGHTYNSTTSGAGHLANGNIWWDKNGNVSVKGNIEADSMTIKAVASYSDAASLGTGKMWFTNYGSAKNISHGEILNANVSLRDDDPVILFKRERTVGSGEYDFFVLNPLLLSNGSTETRTTQIGFLDDSTPSSTPIRMLVNDKIVKRWTRSGAITKVVKSTPGSSDVTRYISSDQGGYLFMFRVVDAANCLYKDDNNVLVYHPITGAEPRSIYDSVIEITALYCQSPNAHILYDTIYLYPAYAGNGSRRYSTNTGNVGYYISTSIKQETLSSGTTVYDIVADTQKTLRASKEVYVMQKTNINGHSDVVYLNSGYNYGTLLTSNVSLANDSSCTVYSQRLNSGYADSYTTSTFAWNCESGLTPSDLV